MHLVNTNDSSIPSDNWRPPFVTLETSYVLLYFIFIKLIKTKNNFRMGKMIIELYWDHAPNTCRNFAELSRRGYYNSTKFHRVVKDFIVQGGDPTGTGRGGASIYGKYFNDEITPLLKHTGNNKNSFFFFLFISIDQ